MSQVVDVIVRRGGDEIDTLSKRPVRIMHSGHAGVVYGGVVHPLHKGNFIDVLEPSKPKESCLGYLEVGHVIPYAPFGKKQQPLVLTKWHVETNQFGNYLVFDGSEAAAETVGRLVPLHLRALEIYEQNFGVDTPAAAPALRMLAWNGLVRLHHDEALGFAERALAIARRDVRDTDSLARSLSMLSSIQLERGHLTEARAAADEALEIGTRALGEAHPMVAQLLLESGLVALQGGARDEARDKLTRSIALREREFGRVDAEVGRALTGLVELELLEHHGAAAIAMAREVRAIGQSPAIESENVRAEGAYLLARALRASGSRAERAEIPALVAEAREVYAASPEWARRLAEIDAWAQQR